MNKKEIISKVKFRLLEKYTAKNLLPSEEIINDCIDKTLEAINYTRCCTELNHDFETGEDVWLTEKKIVEISSFCEDSERMEIIEDGKYKIVDKDKLNKVV